MIPIPDKIKRLYRSDNDRAETKKYIRLRFYEDDTVLLFPDDSLFPADDLFPQDAEPFLTIGNEQISAGSLTITEMLCEDALKFGACCGAMVEVVVADVGMDVTGKEFLLTIECGGYEMAMGMYRVESFKRQADRRLKKITAYNRMRKFHVDTADWYNSQTFPMTLKQLRDSLCRYIGIDQLPVDLPLDQIQISKTIEPSKLYGLDVLRSICEINGGFGQIDKMGRLKYVFLANSGLFPADDLFPSEELFPASLEGENLSHYKQSGTDYEDYMVFGIDKLKIRQEEGDIGVVVGNGTNAYTIQGNFLVYGKSSTELEQIAEAAFKNISGRLYRPCSITSQACPWVEPGDGIICYTTDDVIETYCFRRTISGIQGMMDTFEASGDQKREDDFGVKNQIIQLEGKTAVVKKSVEEVSVKVSDLKEFTEAQVQILSDQILLEVSRATEEEAKLAASIKVNADQILMKVSKGEVSSEISMESDKVVISGNRLIVNSTNFQLDGDGNATFSGDIRGSNIYGSSISGGRINIGGGTFLVDVDGTVTIESGEINIGGVSINEKYTDLGAFRVSSSGFGALFSVNNEVWLTTSAWVDGGPALELKKNGKVTRVGSGGISTGDIDLSVLESEYGSQWSGVSHNIIELWNRIAEIESIINV